MGRSGGLFVGLLALSTVVAFAAPSAIAAADAGTLTFGALPALRGELSASGAGELALGATEDGATPTLEGSGKDVLVKAFRSQDTEVGPLSLEPPEEDHEETPFAAATWHISRAGADFRALVFGGGIEVGTFTALDVPLSAYAGPGLVLDDYLVDQDRSGETKVFTYTASGDRFPVAAPMAASQGAFTIFLWDATLVVTDEAGAAQEFTSGSVRSSSTAGTVREVNEYHLVTVGEGTASAVSAALVAWIEEPTFVVRGSLATARATGDIDVDGSAHSLDDVPVTIIGDYTLQPKATGEPVAQDTSDHLHAGTTAPSGGVYTAMEGDIDGEIEVLAIGPQNVLPQRPDVPVIAATVGILTLVGAALAMLPKVKWALFSVVAPLYAKTQRDRLLDNVSRDRIFQAIRSNPGINLSQIQRIADLGWGATVYHLKMMEKKGLIFSEAGERDRCFFENEPRLRQMRDVIAVLANKEPAQRIARAIAESPGLNQSDVIQATGMTQRSVSYHLGRLTKKQLVAAERDKNFVRYAPTDRLVGALSILGLLAVGVAETAATGAVTVPPLPA